MVATPTVEVTVTTPADNGETDNPDPKSMVPAAPITAPSSLILTGTITC